MESTMEVLTTGKAGRDGQSTMAGRVEGQDRVGEFTAGRDERLRSRRGIKKGIREPAGNRDDVGQAAEGSPRRRRGLG